MRQAKRTLSQILLGTLTCILLVAMSTPAWSRMGAASTPSGSLINQHVMANLQAAESVLMSQGMVNTAPQRYVVMMTASSVVPSSPMTEARGVAGAVLVGDRLVVRGDFGDLSSPFRDYATDPVSPPNPNITSAVHIHRGEPGKNGPFQYALSVMLNETGMAGRLMGEYTLTPEQLTALSSNNLYMDMHTQKNRAGELRGTFRAL